MRHEFISLYIKINYENTLTLKHKIQVFMLLKICKFSEKEPSLLTILNLHIKRKINLKNFQKSKSKN